MKLKTIEGAYVYCTADGRIAINQDSSEFGECVNVYLTLDQFRLIQKWVSKNELEIDAAWNGGVQDEPEA